MTLAQQQQQQYSPAVPSPLSAPSPHAHPPAALTSDMDWASDPALPSSPTPPGHPQPSTSRARPPRTAAGADRPTLFKSQGSSRRARSAAAAPPQPLFSPLSSSPVSASSKKPFPHSSSSSLSNQTRRIAQENARLSRANWVRKQRTAHAHSHSHSGSADPGTDPSSSSPPLHRPIADEPGGWVDGEWEEFDDEEIVRLELEMRRARREYEHRIRRMEELASEDGWLLAAEAEAETRDLEAGLDAGGEDGMEPDPPLDVLYDPDPDPDPDLDPNPSSAPDSLMTASRPSAIPTTTTNTATSPDLDVFLSEFDSALLASPFCPACGATPTPLRGDAHTGLWCGGGGGGGGGGATNDAIELGGAGAVKGGCGWGIGIEGLRPLREAFVRHGSPLEGHRPLLSYTPFTGTIVWCAVPDCDEQFGA